MNKFLNGKFMNCLNKQQGMSLIGLMIGMLLSVLSVLAAMTMYHNMVDVAIDTRHDAEHDAQLATALQTVQLELQSAGFGIAGATVANELATPDNQKLYWRYRAAPNSGAYICRGVEYSGGTLTLVNKSPCTAATALSGNWTKVQMLASFTTAPNITFAKTTASCFPYGRSTAGNHGLVTITAQSAAHLAGGANVVLSMYKTCLPNLS